MNLGDIELKVYDRMGFNSTPDSAVTRRMRGYINDAQREILSKKAYSRLRRKTIPAVAVASSPFMVMAQAAVSIINIADRTNNRNLDVLSLADIRYRDPGLAFGNSIPDAYAVINMSAAVAQDPSAAASLFVVSDSAVDGSGLSIAIEGILSDGNYRRATVAMNGLTAVNVDLNCATWVYVTKFYASGSAAGTISLHQTSGVGTELARITKGRSYARYTCVHLSPTPSTALTYYCDVNLHVEDMSNVNDEPMIPEDFHWMMECGAMKREYLRRGKMAELQVEQSNWKMGLSDLTGFVRSMGGVKNNGQRSTHMTRGSQLGSNFPAGS